MYHLAVGENETKRCPALTICCLHRHKLVVLYYLEQFAVLKDLEGICVQRDYRRFHASLKRPASPPQGQTARVRQRVWETLPVQDGEGMPGRLDGWLFGGWLAGQYCSVL